MVQRDGHGGIAAAKGFSGGWPVPAKPCDSCKSASALLFCRADSAFLCLACDAKVHGANKLASRHERVWMCEVCEQAPASVTCKADAAALCVSCDADIHSANPLARRHERFPVVPFFEPASAALIKSTTASLLNDDDDDGNSKVKPVPEDDENNDNDVLREREEAEAASWLLLNPNAKVMEAPVFKASDFFFSDVDPYLDLDYGPPMEPRFGMRNSSAMDSVVPVQTMPTSTLPPPHLPPSSDPHYFDAADYGRPKPCYSYTTPSISHSVSSSSLDVGVVPDGAGISYGGSVVKGGMDMTSGGGAGQLVGVDREARVLRYREKRKNRKFEKTIRYASRKAYAETRPRIKGRFAKRTEVDGDLDRIFSSAAAMMADTAGYGVVPSF